MADKQKTTSKKLKEPIELNWWWRIGIYVVAVAIAVLLICVDIHECLVTLFIDEYDKSKNSIVDPRIVTGTFIFAFILSIATWVIRTFDKKKEFYDSLKLRSDAIFAEFTKLALSDKNPAVRAQGVLGLVRLKRKHPDYKSQVDDVTSTTKIELKKVVLRNVDLSGANLRGVDLSEADLREVNLSGADLREVDLCGAVLRKADLTNAKCGIELHESGMILGVNLEMADLRGANLEKAIGLDSASLAGAEYDDDTELPSDVDPDEYEMIKSTKHHVKLRDR